MAKPEAKRGDIWLIDLGEHTDDFSGLHGIRPCVIISNDISNDVSPCVIVVVMTLQRSHLPYFVRVTKKDGSNRTGYVNCGNISTTDKEKFDRKLGQLSDEAMEKINQSLRTHLELE